MKMHPDDLVAVGISRQRPGLGGDSRQLLAVALHPADNHPLIGLQPGIVPNEDRLFSAHAPKLRGPTPDGEANFFKADPNFGRGYFSSIAPGIASENTVQRPASTIATQRSGSWPNVRPK